MNGFLNIEVGWGDRRIIKGYWRYLWQWWLCSVILIVVMVHGCIQVSKHHILAFKYAHFILCQLNSWIIKDGNECPYSKFCSAMLFWDFCFSVPINPVGFYLEVKHYLAYLVYKPLLHLPCFPTHHYVMRIPNPQHFDSLLNQ